MLFAVLATLTAVTGLNIILLRSSPAMQHRFEAICHRLDRFGADLDAKVAGWDRRLDRLTGGEESADRPSTESRGRIAQAVITEAEKDREEEARRGNGKEGGMQSWGPALEEKVKGWEKNLERWIERQERGEGVEKGEAIDDADSEKGEKR